MLSTNFETNGLKPVMTVTETAELLRIGRTTAYVAVRAGKIPAARVGGQYRIVTSKLMAWLERGGLSTLGERAD